MTVKPVIGEAIGAGTPYGDYLGFTADKFQGYLWDDGHQIYISAVRSIREGQGNLRQLFERINIELGRQVSIPNPFPVMEEIARKWGFERTVQAADMGGFREEIDVWVMKPRGLTRGDNS